MGLFQFGALMFPKTNNNYVPKLVVYHVATVKGDMDTMIFLEAL